MLNIQLTDIPAVLVGLYATEFALITLTILLTAFLSWSRPIPSLFDASKLGRLPRLLGFAAKSLPRLLVAFHYLILLIILILIGQVANNRCGQSVRPTDTALAVNLSKKDSYEVTEMQKEAGVLVAVVSVMWVVMHVGGWVAKSLIYVEPWMSEPWDPKGGKVMRTICVSCGP